jgi:DNA invertase Pin-like site-specific DNA recombinase
MQTSAPINWVCYYRCSTEGQGRSGLGLEAQRATVAHFLASHPGEVIAEFTEVESGRKANRPKLKEALGLCRKRKAHLVIAKLDRLARSVAMISSLMDSGVPFSAADMPNATRFMLHVYSAMAEEEARLISERTKASLAAAKARGVVLGETGRVLAKRHHEQAIAKAEQYREVVEIAKASGAKTTRDLKDYLNQHGVPSPGDGSWHIPNTHRLLKRLGY